jgi:hypothetical protein
MAAQRIFHDLISPRRNGSGPHAIRRSPHRVSAGHAFALRTRLLENAAADPNLQLSAHPTIIKGSKRRRRVITIGAQKL